MSEHSLQTFLNYQFYVTEHLKIGCHYHTTGQRHNNDFLMFEDLGNFLVAEPNQNETLNKGVSVW